MCGLGHWELLLILGIVVLLFGAKKLPGLATGLGQSLRAFKKSVSSPDELEEGTTAAAEPKPEAKSAADEPEPKADEPPAEKKS
jgi:sec-independent protein translocase protein TatA